MKTMMSRWMMLVLTAGLLMGAVGCKGTDSRRVPIGESTRPELDDQRQLPVSLVEFRELATADILQSLPTMRGISETPGRATILMGDINNKTTSMSTNDYEYVLSGLRSNLIRSRAAGNKLKFVEERRRVENLASKERVATAPAPKEATGEEIRWGGGSYYVPDYDAASTFALLMDVYEIRRSETALYYIEVMVVSLSTNEILDSFKTETKQVMDR